MKFHLGSFFHFKPHTSCPSCYNFEILKKSMLESNSVASETNDSNSIIVILQYFQPLRLPVVPQYFGFRVKPIWKWIQLPWNHWVQYVHFEKFKSFTIKGLPETKEIWKETSLYVHHEIAPSPTSFFVHHEISPFPWFLLQIYTDK